MNDDAILYPEIESDDSGWLDVGDGHRVWWEASGARDGIPALMLHGGPGGPTKPRHRRFYDPDAFRFVTMHQRGCGLSTPLAETRGNDTAALIRDIEQLRETLGIDRWVVTGGSWGSALGLAYGEAHPDRCLGFAFTGIALCRPEDRWWWWHGAGRMFPEAFDAMLQMLPPDQRDDPSSGFQRLLTDPDPRVHLSAAHALVLFSAATVGVAPNPALVGAYDDPDVSLPLARLYLHYSHNGWFFRPNQLLEDLHRIVHLPCALATGRNDVTTPPDMAWTLHRAWPGSTLEIVDGAAHSLADEPMARAYLAAIERMKDVA